MGIVVFGLTGGIGSGKSTVAKHFRQRGLPVIDADVLAREVVAVGSEGLSSVVAAFGADVLQSDGSLDRAQLAKKVFENPEQRARLEAITHPRVRALAKARLAELEARAEPLACYEVPLLFEAGLEREYHPAVVVSVPYETQLARASARDSASREQIQKRISAQLPLSDKVRRADYVIDNAGALEQTLASADRVLAQICRGADVDPARYGV
ncbi:MAG: dephospho-CoA kinase [Polyangiaceae bacterium]